MSSFSSWLAANELGRLYSIFFFFFLFVFFFFCFFFFFFFFFQRSVHQRHDGRVACPDAGVSTIAQIAAAILQAEISRDQRSGASVRGPASPAIAMAQDALVVDCVHSNEVAQQRAPAAPGATDRSTDGTILEAILE